MRSKILLFIIIRTTNMYVSGLLQPAINQHYILIFKSGTICVNQCAKCPNRYALFKKFSVHIYSVLLIWEQCRESNPAKFQNCSKGYLFIFLLVLIFLGCIPLVCINLRRNVVVPFVPFCHSIKISPLQWVITADKIRITIE